MLKQGRKCLLTLSLRAAGDFQGTPVSIVSTLMGAANMDFVVRECRQAMLCFKHAASVHQACCKCAPSMLQVEPGTASEPQAPQSLFQCSVHRQSSRQR